MESKHLLMSPSIIQLAVWNLSDIALSAEWHPLFVRKPCEESRKSGSYTASRMSLMASCTILSLGWAIDNGLEPPNVLGM